MAITTHKSPDGDALGSMLGLAAVLRDKGCDVTCVSVNDFADFLQWMPGADKILIQEHQDAFVKQAVVNAEVVFCLDYNALGRVENVGHYIAESTGKVVMIDHHLRPDDFAHITVSDPTVGSTAELVYDFLTHAYGRDVINEQVAGCLYAGVVTDTGSFRFPSTRPQTHQMAAHLLELGLDHSKIHDAVYDTYSYARMKLVGYALSEKLTYLPALNSSIIVLDENELARFSYKKGDTEGLVNMGLSIMGVRFAALITQSEGLVKMSLRSKGDMPANELAAKYFNGGGHKNAAGGRSDLDPEATKSLLIEKLDAFKSFLV